MFHLADSEAISVDFMRTEVGVTPKDWSVRALKSCLQSPASYGINAPAVPFDDRLPTYLRITDISENHQFSPSPRVSVRNTLAQSYLLREGDLVFARTGASVGKSYLYRPDDGPLVFAGYLIRVSPDPEQLNPAFLSYWVQSKIYWDWVKTMSIRSGQPGINGQEFEALRLPLPPLAEQHAIVEALADVDKLINALERRIDKKRALRKAAMQQLLSGKVRLPTFKGEWLQLNMARDSVVKARIGWQGLTTAEYLTTGYNFLVTGTDLVNGSIDWTRCHYVDQGRFDQDENIQLSSGDVLLTKDGTIGKAGFVDDLPGPATLNSGVFVIRPRAGAYVPKYLYYVLTSRIFEDFLTRLQAGSTISHLYQNDFVHFAFPAPQLEEQRAITNFLSNMDSEVIALEQHREKTFAIRIGMMQQLLTGRTRLVS